MKTQTLISAVAGLLITSLGVVKGDVANLVGGGLLTSHTIASIRKKDTETINYQPVTRVYIDGANTLGATDSLKFKTDFTALAKYISEGKDNVNFNYYFAVSENPTYEQIAFIKYLEKNGYNVVQSLKKQLPEGNYKNKGDDVQIATDTAIDAHKNDHIILVSGDGDFTYTVEKLKGKGCYVTVVSTRECLSKELKNIADNVIDLADIKDDIQRHDKPNKSHPKPPTFKPRLA